jgi:tripartite-type tricarboxylate transporter receptor subunit TctC
MPHLWFSYVASKLGFKVKHVGYRGSAPALLDLIAGSVNLMVDAYNPSCQRQATGEVRVLGYAWDKRLAVQPDVPTLKEQGFDLPSAGATFGIIAPKGTPDEIIAKLNAAFNTALNDPAARAVLEKNSLLPSGGTPADYKAFVADQIQQWTKVARDNHIEAEQ